MSELIVPEQTIYAAGALLLGIVSVVFAGWTFRLPEQIRIYGFATAVISGSLTVGYLLMANDILTVARGESETPFGRFVGYAFLFGIAIAVLWEIAGGSRAWGAVLFGATYLWIASVVTNWLTTGIVELAALLGILVSFVTVLFVLLGPLSAAVRDASGERKLLYGKLRNLTILVLVMYLLVGIINDHGIGLLDTFVGAFVAVYLDVIFVIGIGAILLRSSTALEQTVGGHEPESADVDGPEPAGDGPPVGESPGVAE